MAKPIYRGSCNCHFRNFLVILFILISPFFISSCVSFTGKTTESKAKEQTKQTNKKEEKNTSKAVANKAGNKKQKEIVYSINFEEASKSGKDARTWLKDNGFEFKSAADNQSKLDLSFKNNSLYLQAKSGIFALIIKGINIQEANYIRITWGIDQFPEGASYKKGINNEALMFYTYFGDKKLSSDSVFIPNSPYFIGLFLGKNEDLDKPYVGKHFKEGGRFICVGMPKENETVISEFDLDKGFKECFGNGKKVPFVSAIAIESETSDSGAGKAFLKKIEYLK